MLPMRALTLFDPWATFVAHGVKEYETRSFQVSYRGPLAIHSSKGFTKYHKALCAQEPYGGLLMNIALNRDEYEWRFLNMPRGCIIAVADLVGIVSTDYMVKHISSTEQALGDYTPGRYAWSLMNARLLKEPIPVRGALGLWIPSDEIRERIEGENKTTS